MVLGISYKNVDKTSFLGLCRDVIFDPPAASTTYLVNAQTLVGVVVGTALTLTTAAGRPLPYGRRLSVTTFDNAGSDLTCSVRIVGRRFGVQITETVACTAGGTGATFAATRVYDEIVSATVVAIANNGASDTISVGFDANWIGLMCPFQSRRDIRMIFRNVAGTPDTAGPKFMTDITTAMVNTRDAAIDINALYSTVMLATHVYVIEYEASGAGIEDFSRKGLRFQ